MEQVVLLKYGEVALKGLNRSRFEDSMQRQVAQLAARFGRFAISRSQSTMYLEPAPGDTADMGALARRMADVFGFSAVALAIACEKDIARICAAAVQACGDELRRAATFKVEARRADKAFALGSPEISREVGAAVLAAFPHLKVDVHAPQVTVRVEVRERAAYVHTGGAPGAGGMPLGTGGRGVLLLSGGIDSPVAGFMMARRGVELTAVHFTSPPYTSERARDKVVALAKRLSYYCGRITLITVPFTEVGEDIRRLCREDFTTLALRRMMMLCSELLARENRCLCLITGESLAQVASQTMQSIAATGHGLSLPVLRPLIGMDKRDIVDISARRGFYETSILPYEDCCTIFTPRHPKTRPRIDGLEQEIAKLDVQGLLARAMDARETQVIAD